MHDICKKHRDNDRKNNDEDSHNMIWHEKCVFLTNSKYQIRSIFFIVLNLIVTTWQDCATKIMSHIAVFGMKNWMEHPRTSGNDIASALVKIFNQVIIELPPCK